MSQRAIGVPGRTAAQTLPGWVPAALAPPDWETLVALAHALVAASHDQYRGWGDVGIFAACTASRIGEVSGCRVENIDTRHTGLTWFADAGVQVQS